MERTDVYPGSKWWEIDFHVHTPASGTEYGKHDASEEEILMCICEQEYAYSCC